MDYFRIRGGKPLQGSIDIGGAKNSVLELIPASLLTSEKVTLSNVPNLKDIETLLSLLKQHGADIEHDPRNHHLSLITPKLTSTKAPYDIVKQMRASIYVLGPLLAREGHAEVSLPGGCVIGARPVDLHLKAMEQLGAEVDVENGYIIAKAKGGRLKGGSVVFSKLTHGGTVNALMAAVLAKGETVISNASIEPEIDDLAHMLILMGAKIEGLGTSTLHVQGVDELKGCSYGVMADRLEAGTYAVAAGITRGKIELKHASLKTGLTFFGCLQEAGLKIQETAQGIIVDGTKVDLQGVDITAEPYPGFPTDLQPTFMTLMCLAKGASIIKEEQFENRFMQVAELNRLGADITITDQSTAVVRGVDQLEGAEVMASDIRAGAALVLAGLAAAEETIVQRIYHIDRGYEQMEEKLRACGAMIERVHPKNE